MIPNKILTHQKILIIQNLIILKLKNDYHIFSYTIKYCFLIIILL